MQKFVADLCFGIALGLGLLLAYGVLHVIQIIIGKS